ncbi:hypothetical protein N8364_03385 [Saprospiraceae bacterium]|nr:hypothetical protein [Saprospiraceae bacterium]
MYKILLPLLILFISCVTINEDSNNECSLELTENGVERFSNTVNCYDDWDVNAYSVSEKEGNISSSWGEWIVSIEFESGVDVGVGGYMQADFSKFRILQSTSGGHSYVLPPATLNEPFDFTITQYGGVGGYMQADFTGNLVQYIDLQPSQISAFEVSLSVRIVDKW